MAARRSRSQGRPEDFEPLVRGFLRLPHLQIALGVAILFVGIVVAVIQYRSRHAVATTPNAPTPSSTSTQSPTSGSAPSPTVAGGSVQMLLGNPSGATADPSNRDNFLEIKPYFALSYNNSKGTPNWVSWRVAASDLGDSPRKQVFDADNMLPSGFKVVVHKDYTGGGFDRGHMCPHSDRGGNADMSYATFVMTNIIPQAPNVNQKAWAQFEIYARDLVRRDGKRLYVIAGPHGEGGVGTFGPANTVGKGKVTVPASCWKIVVAVPDSGADEASKITSDARVIAIDMPNDNSAVGYPWAGYRVTPADIEAKTGYRFFDALPTEVADSLRKKLDTTYVPPPKPLTHNRE